MERFDIGREVFKGTLESLYWALPLIIISYSVVDAFLTRRAVREKSKHSLIRSRVPFAPSFILSLLYVGKAVDLIQDGYKRFKNSAFQLTRSDGQIIILPLSLLEELAALPVAVASPQGALEQDLLGYYTGINSILENRLHHTIVQRRLTPRLPLLIPRMENAVTEAVKEYLPMCEDWVEFQPYYVLGHISARAASDVLVGPAFCTNKTWLDTAFSYTENLFRTVVILRSFPRWMLPLTYPLLPSYWIGWGYMNRAKQLLRPKLQELIKQGDDGTWEPQDGNADDMNLLSWLASLAKGRDRDPDTISHVLVLVALASVHTTLIRIVEVIYDLVAAGPTLLDELLGEINTVSEHGWDVSSYDQLHRFDSVIGESQRMSPPTILGMKRIFHKPYTFQDGTHIPAGTYAALPIHAIENDAAYTSNPSAYDGLRTFRAREEFQRQMRNQPAAATADADKLAAKAKEFQFSTPTRTSLGFGYGKTACPGRFFASVLVKMTLVKLLTEYEFKFLPGTGRPKDVVLHEFLFPWPWQKLLVRRRKEGTCPF
ncbi:cytochrome P450 [Annulohypoxylon bovei var. microspora]|nr:cytochrome P450 [Annulohypoxylon bovei var. microspora]